MLVRDRQRMRARSFGGGGLLLPAGVRMFVTGAANDKVYQYDMTTAGDISTASFTQDFFVSSQDGLPTGVFFKPDGLKMYVIGEINDSVFEYVLTSPYDVSTASFNASKSLLAQDSGVRTIYITNDGLKMFMLGIAADRIYQYSLSTPWDITTAVYQSKFFNIASYETQGNALTFNPDGTKMYFGGLGWGTMHEVTLSIPFDFGGTETYVGNEFYDSPNGFVFNEDGTKAYTVKGYSSDEIYEWSLSTPYSIFVKTLTNTFSVAAQDIAPYGIFLSRAVYR